MKLFHRRTPAPVLMPVLQTERLILRGFQPDDVTDLFAYCQSPKVGPMAGWAPHQTLDDSRRIIEGFISGGEVWAIVEKKSGHVIGSLGLHAHATCNVEGARELGYVLGEAYWNNGYATEACRAALAYAFDQLDCRQVRACHFPFNKKSRHVIQKLGFTYEGTLRQACCLPDGAWTDKCLYSMLRNEYEAQKR